MKYSTSTVYVRAGETFWGRVPNLSINLEKFPSRVHGNFEEQNQIFFSLLVIINYHIIVINLLTYSMEQSPSWEANQ